MFCNNIDKIISLLISLTFISQFYFHWKDNEDGDEGSEVISESYPFQIDTPSIIRKFSSHLPIEDCPINIKDLATLYEIESPSFLDASCTMLSSDSQSSLASNSSEKSERKGKYGKYQAPKPPNRDIFFSETYKVLESYRNPEQNINAVNSFKPSLTDNQLDVKNGNFKEQSNSQTIFACSNKNEVLSDDESLIKKVSDSETPFETTVWLLVLTTIVNQL